MPDKEEVTTDQSTNNSVSAADKLYPAKTEQTTTVDADKVAADKAATDKAEADKKVAEDKAVADKAAADAKAAEDAKNATPEKTAGDQTPAKIELKAPEGVEVSKEHLDAVTAFATEKKLSPEVAQEVLNREIKVLADHKANETKMLEAKKVEWAEMSKNDKEIGGEAFENNLKIAQKAYALAPQSWKTFLETTGLGSHPDSIKFFLKIGKSGMSDTLAPATSENHAAPKTAAKSLYPNMT